MYGRTISQKFHLGGFQWIEEISQFNVDFMKNYDDDSNIGYFLGVAFQYPEKLNKLYNNLLFLSEKMKIGKTEKLLFDLYGIKEYVIRKKIFKTSNKSWISTKKISIKFNQEAWLKPYTDMNTGLREKNKKCFQVDKKCSFWENYRTCENIMISTL